jgi:hypothetical protein
MGALYGLGDQLLALHREGTASGGSVSKPRRPRRPKTETADAFLAKVSKRRARIETMPSSREMPDVTVALRIAQIEEALLVCRAEQREAYRKHAAWTQVCAVLSRELEALREQEGEL